MQNYRLHAVSGPDSNCRCEGNEVDGADGAGTVSVEGRVVASQLGTGREAPAK